MNALDAFNTQLKKLDSLRDSNIEDSEFIRWRMLTREVFRRFLPRTEYSTTFEGISFDYELAEGFVSDTTGLDPFQRGWTQAAACLEGAIEHIQMFDLAESIGSRKPDANSDVLVLISHSSKDKELAEALIDLLRSALPLSAKQIRCTSVDGYRLPVGVDTNERLRTEIAAVKVLVGLLTANSLSSTYVLFELGARWAARLPMYPVTAGISPSEMRGPSSVINALSCDTESQLIQLVEDIGTELGLTVESAGAYLPKVRSMMARASSMPSHTKTPVTIASTQSLKFVQKRDETLESFVRTLAFGPSPANRALGIATVIITNNEAKPNAIVRWDAKMKNNSGNELSVDLRQTTLTQRRGGGSYPPCNVSPIPLPAHSATEAHLLFVVDVHTLPNPVVFEVRATDLTSEVHSIQVSIPNELRNEF